MEHSETAVGVPSPGPSTPPEWQFSLRSLFIVTTIVSIGLAIGTYFAGFMFVVSVIAMIQVVTLFTADWLIRPANRKALAFVTAGSWIVFGSGIAIIAVTQFHGAIINQSRLQALLAAGLTFSAVMCFYTAAHRWWKLTAYVR